MLEALGESAPAQRTARVKNNARYHHLAPLPPLTVPIPRITAFCGTSSEAKRSCGPSCSDSTYLTVNESWPQHALHSARLARSTAADKSRLKLITFGGSRGGQILEQLRLRRAL